MEYTEITESQITRRQHYVPKAYLRNFAIDNQDGSKVYVLFPKDENSKVVSIDNICCKSYLYDEIAIDSKDKSLFFAAPNEIENSFIELEGEYARIISKLKNDLQLSNEFELTEEDINKLRTFMSVLLFRHPTFVNIVNYVVKKKYLENQNFIDDLKEYDPKIPINVYISLLANYYLKMMISPKDGLLPTALMSTIKNSHPCIFKTDTSTFITSSLPIANLHGVHDGLEYGIIGMPITPNLFLAFVDIDHNINSVVTIDNYAVRHINGKQVKKGNQLLISNHKDILTHIDISSDVKECNSEWFFETFQINKESFLEQYEDFMDSKEIKYWREPHDQL